MALLALDRGVRAQRRLVPFFPARLDGSPRHIPYHLDAGYRSAQDQTLPRRHSDHHVDDHQYVGLCMRARLGRVGGIFCLGVMCTLFLLYFLAIQPMSLIVLATPVCQEPRAQEQEKRHWKSYTC